jgi:hypothetical protein
VSTDSIELSTEQIDQLATKLDSLEEVLDETDKTILLAVFELASQSLAESGEDNEVEGFAFNASPTLQVRSPAGLPRLSQGFKSSFSTGIASRFADDGGGTTGQVTVGVMW